MKVLAREDFYWNEDRQELLYAGKPVCKLIPHKTIPAHWHLKFYWKDEPTAEFFNIFNARENARNYSRQHEQEKLTEPRGDV